jgi:hypothetical protein
MMTRAELEKWYTIYVSKVYANTFHRGIKTTPLAKYKEGILGTADRPGHRPAGPCCRADSLRARLHAVRGAHHPRVWRRD